MMIERRAVAGLRRLVSLCACLAVVHAAAPRSAGSAATSRGGGEDFVRVGGGRVPVPGSLRVATRRLPGGPAAVLLFSDTSVQRAWERAGVAGGDEVLIEIFPWSGDLGLEERARLFEDDLRAVGWKDVARASRADAVALTASAEGRVRGHIFTSERHIRVTASKRSAAFEQALSGSGDAG